MKLIPFLMTLLVLTSCASKNPEEKDIEEKVAHEKTIDPNTFGQTIHDLISSSKTLTAKQKSELEKIIAANKERAMALSQESYKFRSVLVKELLSGKINEKEIKLIKEDIRKIEAARLKNTFDTVEKISSIVSKHPENHEFAKHLIYLERPIR